MAPEFPLYISAANKLNERFTRQGHNRGENIYKRVAENYGSEKAASEELAKLGIPGSRYLDQGSRIPPKSVEKIAELEQQVNKLKAMAQ